MAAKRLIVAFFVLFTLALASQAIAAPAVQATVTPAISWLYVQHRTYEAAPERNLLAFGCKDASSGAAIVSDDLESVTLYDPGGNPLTVSKPTFSVYKEMSGEYDGKNGIWQYGVFSKTADYSAYIEQELVLGTYHLVAMFGGAQVEATFERKVEVDLPVIPSSSIKSKLDSSGNLICQWAVDYDLSNSHPALATFVKVVIEVKKGGKFIGDLGYRVPTHLGRLFVPKAVVDAIKALGGGSHTIAVNLRTSDNGTRSKSTVRKLVLK